tara:strand:- start:57344 stop:57871 length:528 start_codon:yes stop_codon:yes gene_type:complete
MTDSSSLANDGRSDAPLVHRVDLVVTLVLFAISLWLFYVTTTFEEVSALFSTGMAPEIYPQCILVVIMGLGVFIPFEHRFVEGGAKRLSKGRDKPLPRNTILTALLMIVIASQMPTLGALLTVILICLLMPIMWGERRPIPIIAFTVIFTLCIWALFNYALKVHFEPGLLSVFFE